MSSRHTRPALTTARSVTRTTARATARTTALGLALALAGAGLAACTDGDDDPAIPTTVAGSDEGDAETSGDTATSGEDAGGTDDSTDGGDLPPSATPVGEVTADGYLVTTSRDDLVELEAAGVLEIVPDPLDESSLLVRYESGAEPCSGANVVVQESEDAITVGVTTGLDPNAAAMTCPAGLVRHQIAVALDAPAGTRTISLAD